MLIHLLLAHSVNSKASTTWLTVNQKTYDCDWWSFFIWNYFAVSEVSECNHSSIKTWKWNKKRIKEVQETWAIDANVLFQYLLFNGRNNYNLCNL